MTHCGHLVARLLANYGIEVVFGMPGGQTAALYDGIHALAPRIRHVMIRDERSAGYAADAYARVTGKVGVCDATVGPGATKFVDALGEALNNSIPLIALVGEHPVDWAPLRELGIASQAIDQVGFLKPITKAVYEVTSPTTLAPQLRNAFRTATSNRPGPVAVLIPHDVFDTPWDENEDDVAADPRYTRVPAHRPRPEDDELARAAELIGQARRPAIIAGGGATLSGARAEVTALARALGACVVTSLTGKGAIKEDDPLSAGLLSPLGPAHAEELTRAADLLVMVGTKCSQNTSINWTIPEPRQVTIQIDLDAGQLGRTFRPSLALQGDARATLAGLLRALPTQPDRTPWRNQIQEARLAQGGPSDGGAVGNIRPQALMRELAALLQPEDIVISDASFSAGWTANFLPALGADRRFLFARGLGSMGYALPAAIGAASVANGARVITVNGDGSVCYALAELATLRQYGFNRVVNIVVNNGALGWLHYWQRFYFGARYLSTEMPEIDFAAAARAFGCHGELVTDPAELGAALRRAFDADRPSMLDVRCDLWETPIRSFVRRLQQGGSGDEPPGTKYTLRPWVQSPTVVAEEPSQ